MVRRIIFLAIFLSVGVPTFAQKVKVKVSVRTVSLSWTASTTTGVNYNIYRGSVAAGPFTKLATVATTSYTDATVVSGLTYVYQITSVCVSCAPPVGGESVPTPQVSVTIPSPPVAPTGLTVTVVVVGTP